MPLADYNLLPDHHKARGRSSPGFCSTRHSLPSPGTAASVMSEDSGVGSEEDLSLAPDQAWEDVGKYYTEEEEEETEDTSSVSESNSQIVPSAKNDDDDDVSKNCLVIKTEKSLPRQTQVDTENDDIMWSGHRNILTAEDDETILSRRGTVRGVKNRVRAGIHTFLQDHAGQVGAKIHGLTFHLKLELQNYRKSECGKCVLYVKSLGILRSTKARCDLVRKILRNLVVR